MNNRTAAEVINKILQYLKANKISQKSAGNRINYTSLSKAKDPIKYPQLVIEKMTRVEVVKALMEEFGLAYDQDTGQISTLHIKDTPKVRDVMHYIMYYYSFARATIGLAWIQVIDKKRVLIDYRVEEHWEGNFEVIENYTFISAEKRGITTPVRKLICLFSGTMKYGRPILLGTYSTVKRDGVPAAGKIVLERYPDRESVLNRFNQEADPRITRYLMDSVFTTLTFTPNSLDDLPHNHQIPGLNGEYIVGFASDQATDSSSMQLNIVDHQKAELEVNSLHYKGSIDILDILNFRIELRDPPSRMLNKPVYFFFFLRLQEKATHIGFVGTCISNYWSKYLETYPCEIYSTVT